MKDIGSLPKTETEEKKVGREKLFFGLFVCRWEMRERERNEIMLIKEVNKSIDYLK